MVMQSIDLSINLSQDELNFLCLALGERLVPNIEDYGRAANTSASLLGWAANR